MQRCGDPRQFAENWEAICKYGPYATETLSTLSDTTEGSLLQLHEIKQMSHRGSRKVGSCIQVMLQSRL